MLIKKSVFIREIKRFIRYQKGKKSHREIKKVLYFFIILGPKKFNNLLELTKKIIKHIIFI